MGQVLDEVKVKDDKVEEIIDETGNGDADYNEDDAEKELLEASEEVDKVEEAVLELVQLRDTLEENVGLESHPVAKQQFDLIARYYGISLEADDEKASLISRINKAIGKAFFSFRDFAKSHGMDKGLLIRGLFIGDIKVMAEKMTKMSDLDKKRFEKYLAGAKSKYVSADGKLIPLGKLIADVRNFDKQALNGVRKAFKAYVSNSANLESKEQVNELLRRVIADSGLNSLEIDLPGFKGRTELSIGDNNKVKVNSDITKAGIFKGTKYPVKASHADAANWLKSLVDNYQDRAKLSREVENTWKVLFKEIEAAAAKLENEKKEIALSGLYTLVSFATNIFKLVYKASTSLNVTTKSTLVLIDKPYRRTNNLVNKGMAKVADKVSKTIKK